MKKRIFRVNMSGQKRVQLLKVPVVFLTISTILLSNILLVIPQEIYAGEVSYLNQQLMSQVVPLDPMDPNQNFEKVPYQTVYLDPDLDTSDLNIGDVDGEVLPASFGVPPITLDCKGVEMSSNKYVCDEFSTRTNVSDDVFSGRSFRKDCEVNVLWATYPAFFNGGDQNGDGRVEIYKGEWPDAASALSQLQPALEYDEATDNYVPIVSEYKETNQINYSPEGTESERPDYAAPTEEPAKFGFEARVQGAGAIAQPPGGDLEMAIPAKACAFPPLATISLLCPSPLMGLMDAVYGDVFMTPDPAKQLGRPIIEETSCPMVEEVPYEFTCIDLAGLTTAWIYPITGLISDIRCLLTDDCYENVELFLFTDSLYGTNFGSEAPSADMYSDMMVAARSIPNPSNQCSSYVEGHNAPCWPDRYIGTPGMCEVCGKKVPCTFVWKNWLYDFYERLRLEEGPCILENGDQFCTFEEYFEHVVRKAGGIPVF